MADVIVRKDRRIIVRELAEHLKSPLEALFQFYITIYACALCVVGGCQMRHRVPVCEDLLRWLGDIH